MMKKKGLKSINYDYTNVEKSKDLFKDNSDFWTNWQHHRNFITDIIKRHIVNNFDFKSIAIWGAGRCKDIDLKFLCDHFEEVNLFDLRSEDVRNGVEFQNLSDVQFDKIIIHEAFDFIDVDINFYSQIKDLITKKASVKAITKIMRKQANSINIDTALSKLEKKYDVSIALGVHSQLFYELVVLYDDVLKNYNDTDQLKLGEENRFLHKVGASLFNDFLYNSVRTGGVVLAGFDIIEFSIQRGTFHLLNTFTELFKQKKVFDNLDFFLIKGAVMGGADGYFDFVKKYINFEKKLPTNFSIWEYFSYQSFFFMTQGFVKE